MHNNPFIRGGVLTGSTSQKRKRIVEIAHVVNKNQLPVKNGFNSESLLCIVIRVAELQDVASALITFPTSQRFFFEWYQSCSMFAVLNFSFTVMNIVPKPGRGL